MTGNRNKTKFGTDISNISSHDVSNTESLRNISAKLDNDNAHVMFSKSKDFVRRNGSKQGDQENSDTNKSYIDDKYIGYISQKSPIVAPVANSEKARSCSTLDDERSNEDFDADDEHDNNSSSEYSEKTNLASFSNTGEANLVNLTKTLLEKLEQSNAVAKESKKLANKYLEKLKKATTGDTQTKDNFIFEHSEGLLQRIHQEYDAKVGDLTDQNRRILKRMMELESAYNTVQKVQSETYQSHLKELKKRLQQKDKELDEFKEEYLQLQQWVLVIFKAIGDRARNWSNKDFSLTVDDICKSLKAPCKKSNLEIIYRYLLQCLYYEKEQQTVSIKDDNKLKMNKTKNSDKGARYHSV